MRWARQVALAGLAGLLVVLGVAGAGAQQPTQAPAASNRPDSAFALVNNTGVTIWAVRLRRAGEPGFGPDLLGANEIIDNGGQRRFEPEAALGCRIEIRLQFADRRTVNLAAFDACRIGRLNVPASVIADIPVPPADARGGGAAPGSTQAPAANTGTPPAQTAGRGEIAAINGWRVQVHSLNARVTGTSAWGPDLLGDAVIAVNARRPVKVDAARGCRWDFQVSFGRSGGAYTRQIANVDVCATRELRLNGPEPGTILSHGSGFFVSPVGHVLTNHHVVEGCGTVSIRDADNRETILKLIGEDGSNDLAVLQAEGRRTPVVRFRDASRAMRPGEAVIVLGYPLPSQVGNQLLVNTGIVSAVRGGRADDTRFTHNAPTYGGNSGGPVLDETGLLIGVHAAGLGEQAQNIKFAIHSTHARRLLNGFNVPIESAEPRETMKPVDIVDRLGSAVLQLRCRG